MVVTLISSFLFPLHLRKPLEAHFMTHLPSGKGHVSGGEPQCAVLTLEQGSEGGVGGWARLLGLLRSGSGVFGPLLHVLWND